MMGGSYGDTVLSGLIKKRQVEDCCMRKVRKILKQGLADSMKMLVVGRPAQPEDEFSYSLPSYRYGEDWEELPCLSPCSLGQLTPWLSFPSGQVKKDLDLASVGQIQPLKWLWEAKDCGSVNFPYFCSSPGFSHTYPWSQDAGKPLCRSAA